MSRRSRENSDSLDMLLDTMCNTFGGIILIALLISMLARDVPATVVTSNADQKMATLQQELTNAIVKHTQLQSELSQHLGTLTLLAEIESLRKKVDFFEAATRDRQHTTAEWERKVEEARQTNLQLSSRLSNLNRHIQQVTEDLQTITNKVAGELRIPRFRRVEGRTYWDIIVKGGKLYPIYKLVNGQKVENNAAIIVKPGPGFFEIELKPGGGTDIRGGMEGYLRLLSPLSAQRYVINYILYADSFALFQNLRKTAIDKGFGYDVMLLKDNEPLRAVPGGGRGPGSLN